MEQFNSLNRRIDQVRDDVIVVHLRMSQPGVIDRLTSFVPLCHPGIIYYIFISWLYSELCIFYIENIFTLKFEWFTCSCMWRKCLDMSSVFKYSHDTFSLVSLNAWNIPILPYVQNIAKLYCFFHSLHGKLRRQTFKQLALDHRQTSTTDFTISPLYQ